MSSFRYGLYNDKKISKSPYKMTKLQMEFIEFIKCSYVSITCNDWLDVFDTFKNDENALILFDPPYMNSCNEFYNLHDNKKKNENVYEYFSLNNIISFKSKIMFILEDMWIINLLFKANFKKTYDKTYNISRKKTNHIIIYNYS